MEPQTTFKHLGYFIEYFVNGKSIGTKNVDQPDRTDLGYGGRTTEVAEENITLDNKKTIKAGTTVKTVLYPLCGRMLRK